MNEDIKNSEINSDAANEESKKEAKPEASNEEKLAQENKELKDKYLRLLAEMENVKKRASAESEQAVYSMISNFSRDILSVSDNLELALKNIVVVEENKPIIDGVQMTLKIFKDALAKNGIEEIKAEIGDEINPKLHRVIGETEKPEVKQGSIAVVLAKGYMLMGKTIREAMVMIAK